MDLKQMTFKQIRELIVFTILCLVGLWKFDVVLEVVSFLWDIVFPFTLGGAIAFIINVPMSFVEKRLFGKCCDCTGDVCAGAAAWRDRFFTGKQHRRISAEASGVCKRIYPQ